MQELTVIFDGKRLFFHYVLQFAILKGLKDFKVIKDFSKKP
jgi:hypothetical protein